MRGFLPVADYPAECCFIAVHENILNSLSVKGSSWGERTEDMSPDDREAFHDSFLNQVGAKKTSKDVHWPMSLAFRMSVKVRSSGLRQRSAKAMAKRNEKKRLRGYGPLGRSSGWHSSWW